MEKFKDKVALITGGTKGIGRGVAEALLQLGMNVAITSRNLTAAEKAAEELSKKGKGKAIGIKADVRKMDSQVQAVDSVLKEFGQLDVLVANAGLGHFASISDLTADEWQETIDTNLTGVFFSVKAALNELKRTMGYIFTISSLAGTNFFAGGSAYNASKFGLTGFTQAIMLDLRQDDVKVSTIMPGSVATHFNGNEPSKEDAWKIQSEDIGELIVDLLKMNPRTLPSKIEVRPSKPPKK